MAAIFICKRGASDADQRSHIMRFAISCLSILVAGCTARPPAPWIGAPQAQSGNPESILLLAHNRERVSAGVQPMSWDPVLAAAAATYARQLAASGSLRHSPRAQRPGQGENLWMGSRGAFAPEQMVGSWAAERRFFRRGIFPAVSTTGNWADVGHYSQMVWPTSMRLGCAIASGARTDVLVCRYAPAGNIDGRPVP